MSIVSLFDRARLLLDFPRMASLLVRLYRDGRVPAWLKLGGMAAAVLIVSPLDIFSDIPLLGPLDDIALLLMLSQFFINMCPPGVVAELNASGTRMPNAQTVRVQKNVTPPN
jgi:uncharacterized membrane protein YkvA (DUF1232 family)